MCRLCRWRCRIGWGCSGRAQGIVWERACIAMQATRVWMPSRASHAPTGFVAYLRAAVCRIHCGSGLARDAGGAVWQAHRMDAIAGKPRSHRFCGLLKSCGLQDPCGSGLARDAGGAVWQAHRMDAIAGKPRSHRFCGVLKSCGLQDPLWERACIAMQAARSGRLTVWMPSRASRAPTGFVAHT